MLTAFDKQLLNLIQTDLPVDSRPFAILAKELGTDESTVLERLKFLKENGYIRRIGPFFDSNRLGYISTLVAVEVTEEALEEVVGIINSFNGVTHNYEREGELNIWFTLFSQNIESQQEMLETIRQQEGVKRLINLPAVQKFKVSVQFTLK